TVALRPSREHSPDRSHEAGRVAGCGSMPPHMHRSLWAMEGLGFFEAEKAHKRREALPRLREDGWPAISEGVFHLGASLAEAIRALRGVRGPGSSASLASALNQFLDFCDRGAPEGCAGVAVEGLGFVARTLFPSVLLGLDRELQKSGDDLTGYFWHGIGRGLYFLFPRALFSHESTSLALRKAKQE